jgi:hypothetical protein
VFSEARNALYTLRCSARARADAAADEPRAVTLHVFSPPLVVHDNSLDTILETLETPEHTSSE